MAGGNNRAKAAAAVGNLLKSAALRRAQLLSIMIKCGFDMRAGGLRFAGRFP
jgi:hypothetical protein